MKTLKQYVKSIFEDAGSIVVNREAPVVDLEKTQLGGVINIEVDTDDARVLNMNVKDAEGLTVKFNDTYKCTFNRCSVNCETFTIERENPWLTNKYLESSNINCKTLALVGKGYEEVFKDAFKNSGVKTCGEIADGLKIAGSITYNTVICGDYILYNTEKGDFSGDSKELKDGWELVKQS